MKLPTYSIPKIYATAALFTGFTLLAGCGGGETGANVNLGTSGTSTQNQSELIVSLTDADGDFVSYTVDVKSLALTHASGAVVETVPQTTRVDFAQYQELTEFFTAATVPSGRYHSAVATVDFSQANILVERNGQAVPANPIDAAGNPLGVVALTIDLDPNRPFIVAPGIPAHLTVDFDLAISNQVNLATEPPSVTVEPVLVAELNPSEPKPHRIRGLLNEVSVAAQQFSLQMRPFWVNTGRFGDMRVHIEAQTEFEIDGETYTGTIGLEHLATLPTNSPLIAFGKVQLPSRQFIASEVHAGSSVIERGLDLAHGTVVARDGTTLTVRGATLVPQSGDVTLNDTVSVTVASTTRVTKQGSRDSVSISDVSVGQRITLAGTITSESSTGARFDASSGWLRMNYSDVAGLVSTHSALELVVNADQINGRNMALYNFAGTGTTATEDANPAAYQINTSILVLTEMLANEPVIVRGFPTAFGTAPADFKAQSVINLADVRTAHLVMTWDPSSSTALTGIQATQMTVSLDNSVRHHVVRHGLATDLTLDGNAITLTGAENAMFLITRGAVRNVFFDFTTFSEAVTRAITDGATLAAVQSVGRYDDATLTFQANRILINLR